MRAAHVRFCLSPFRFPKRADSDLRHTHKFQVPSQEELRPAQVLARLLVFRFLLHLTFLFQGVLGGTNRRLDTARGSSGYGEVGRGEPLPRASRIQ